MTFSEALASVEFIDRVIGCVTLAPYLNMKVMREGVAALGNLVARAIVLASHTGGFDGVRFNEFFTTLMYELGANELPYAWVELKQWSDVVVPFMSPPNVVWPELIMRPHLHVENLRSRKRELGNTFNVSSYQWPGTHVYQQSALTSRGRRTTCTRWSVAFQNAV